MDDSFLMASMDCPSDGLYQFGRLPRRLRRSVEVTIQTATVNELQREEWAAIVFAHLEDLNDVGVLELSNRLCFGFEPRQHIWVRVTACQHHLQRHDAIETNLPRLVNDPHSTAA